LVPVLLKHHRRYGSDEDESGEAVMAAIDDLQAWFEADLKLANWEKNVKVSGFDPNVIDVRLYTDVNEYVLTITEESDGSYIEASVKSRKARAGQDAPRTRHIPLSMGRAPFSQRIWRRLLNSIVAIELVRVQHPDASERVSEARSARPSVGLVQAASR
jgi:hypothetical protein